MNRGVDIKRAWPWLYQVMSHLWKMGYAAEDIVGNVFRVCKTHPMAEYLKLEFIKVMHVFF